MTELQTEMEIRQLLAEMLPDADEAYAALLCRTVLDICHRDVPGNFIMLPPCTLFAAETAAKVLSRHTRQMRTLFLPETLLTGHAGELAGYAGRISIRSMEGLLDHRRNARNWLGKVAFIHAGGDVSQADYCLELLDSQISDQAVVFFEKDSCNNVQQFQDIANKVSASHHYENGMLLLQCNRPSVPDSAVPAGLAAEFREDDPVRSGIFTLMSENERFQLYYAVRKLLPGDGPLLRFIEIGSFQGGTFYEICRALQRESLPFQGISIEPEPGHELEQILRCFAGNAVHLGMFSGQAVLTLSSFLECTELPQLILIDGDHSYAGVCGDIRNYYPLLAPGGLLLFHDYLPPLNDENCEFIMERTGGKPGVGVACREIAERELGLVPLELPLIYPQDPVQTMACQPIIPGVYSTLRAYRKPLGQRSVK